MPRDRFRRTPGAPPLVYGHRGVRGDAPENTMAAFTMAADAGADGIELDVRLCASGQLVVCHDPTLERVSEAGDARSIARLAYTELGRVRLAGGERVPLLSDVLSWARQKGKLVNVEMKRDVPDRASVVRAAAEEIRRASEPASVLVSSFDPWMLAQVRLRMPALSSALLVDAKPRWRSGWPAALVGARAVHPEHTLVERHWMDRVRARLVNVWTVNDPDEASRLAALGVDGIITDVPGALVKSLSGGVFSNP
jgi:glycerophosphoryl diester phosphodiesterase